LSRLGQVVKSGKIVRQIHGEVFVFNNIFTIGWFSVEEISRYFIYFIVFPTMDAILMGVIVVMFVWYSIYNYQCNQWSCEFESRSGELYSIQHYVMWLARGWWFSPGTPFSSTNKTDCPRHNWNIVAHLNVLKLHWHGNRWCFFKQDLKKIYITFGMCAIYKLYILISLLRTWTSHFIGLLSVW
jgi:hypothetical protein